MNEYAQAIESARIEMASAASEFLPDTCRIVSMTSAPNGRGGQITTETINAENIPVSYRAISVREAVGRGLTLSSGSYELTLAHGAKNITPKDMIVIEERGAQGEKTFQIVGTLNDASGLMLRVLAELKG